MNESKVNTSLSSLARRRLSFRNQAITDFDHQSKMFRVRKLQNTIRACLTKLSDLNSQGDLLARTPDMSEKDEFRYIYEKVKTLVKDDRDLVIWIIQTLKDNRRFQGIYNRNIPRWKRAINSEINQLRSHNGENPIVNVCKFHRNNIKSSDTCCKARPHAKNYCTPQHTMSGYTSRTTGEPCRRNQEIPEETLRSLELSLYGRHLTPHERKNRFPIKSLNDDDTTVHKFKNRTVTINRQGEHTFIDSKPHSRPKPTKHRA